MTYSEREREFTFPKNLGFSNHQPWFPLNRDSGAGTQTNPLSKILEQPVMSVIKNLYNFKPTTSRQWA